jgi:hypothetical protein
VPISDVPPVEVQDEPCVVHIPAVMRLVVGQQWYAWFCMLQVDEAFGTERIMCASDGDDCRVGAWVTSVCSGLQYMPETSTGNSTP